LFEVQNKLVIKESIMSKNNIFISKLLMLLVAVLIFMIPFQASADLTYTMTSFQSLGPLYASGEITGDLTGSLNIPILYSFCVNNAALLYEGQPYSASLNSIAGNPGLLESAYLINTYVPENSALTNVNTGVALQWAMWMLLGQGSPLTDTNVQNPTLATTYASIYNQAQQYEQEAQNQYVAGNLSQYAGMYQELQLQGSQSLLLVPTPVPAAVYLFGAGLLGLVGLRKKIMK